MNRIPAVLSVIVAIFASSVSAIGMAKDFLVSCPNLRIETAPDIGADRAGNTVVVWKDVIIDSYGNYYPIRMRRFDANGVARSKTVNVYSLAGNPSSDLKVAVADSGFFAVLFTVTGTANTLCLKRYNKDGTAYDANPIFVTTQCRAGTADVAINNHGDVAVSFRESSYTTGTTAAYIYYPGSATPLALPRGQHYDNGAYIALGDSSRVVSVITTAADGVWQRSGTYSSGLSWNDGGTYPTRSFMQGSKTVSVAMRRTGAYCIVWNESLGNPTNIKGRWYTAAGSPGSVFTVTNERDLSGNDQTVLVRTANAGHSVVKWCAISSEAVHTPYMKVYNASGTTVVNDRVLFLNALYEGVSIEYSSAALNGDNEPVVAANVRGRPVFQYHNASGIWRTPELHATLGSDATAPSAAQGRTCETSAVAWSGADSGRISLRLLKNRSIYDHDTIIRVNSYGRGTSPATAVWSNNAIVAWEDRRDGAINASIWIQVYDPAREPVGPNRQASDIGTSAKVPSITACSNSLVAVWQDVRTSNGSTSHIYGQLLTPAGVPSGTNFQISGSAGGGTAPVAVSDGKNLFAVVWQKSQGVYPVLSSSIFVRWYTGTGIPAGDTVRVSKETAGTAWIPSAAMDSSGNCAIAWTTTAGQVMYSVFNRQRTVKLTEMRADTGTTAKRAVSIALTDQGGFLIAWVTTRSRGTSCEYRTFNADGTPQRGVIFCGSYPFLTTSPAPSVSAADTTVLLTWVNSLCADSSGTDIWAEYLTVKSTSSTSVTQNGFRNIPEKAGKSGNSRGVMVDLRGRLIRSPSIAGRPAAGVFIEKKRNEKQLTVPQLSR